MTIIEWLNEPNANGMAKLGWFEIVSDNGIAFVELIIKVFKLLFSLNFLYLQYFQRATHPASFCVQIKVVIPIEYLGIFLQMHVNSIDEKMIMEYFTIDNSNYLNIRRLPIDCSDSMDEMWNKNLEISQYFPLIRLL